MLKQTIKYISRDYDRYQIRLGSIEAYHCHFAIVSKGAFAFQDKFYPIGCVMLQSLMINPVYVATYMAASPNVDSDAVQPDVKTFPIGLYTDYDTVMNEAISWIIRLSEKQTVRGVDRLFKAIFRGEGDEQC